MSVSAAVGLSMRNPTSRAVNSSVLMVIYAHNDQILMVMYARDKRRIIAGCREAKREFLFGTEMGEEKSERRVLVRMVSYLALGGAQI